MLYSFKLECSLIFPWTSDQTSGYLRSNSCEMKFWEHCPHQAQYVWRGCDDSASVLLMCIVRLSYLTITQYCKGQRRQYVEEPGELCKVSGDLHRTVILSSDKVIYQSRHQNGRLETLLVNASVKVFPWFPLQFPFWVTSSKHSSPLSTYPLPFSITPENNNF